MFVFALFEDVRLYIFMCVSVFSDRRDLGGKKQKIIALSKASQGLDLGPVARLLTVQKQYVSGWKLEIRSVECDYVVQLWRGVNRTVATEIYF